MRPNSQQMARKRPLRKRPLRKRPLRKRHLRKRHRRERHRRKRHLGKTHLRFDDRATQPFRWQDDKLATIRNVWDRRVERLPLMYNPGSEVTMDERLHVMCGVDSDRPSLESGEMFQEETLSGKAWESFSDSSNSTAPAPSPHTILWQSGGESASPRHCPGRSPPKTGAETEAMRALCP
ncbi:unnamed protein product [Gadus morhua 'NCC']